MISLNNQLESFPYIKKKVFQLNSEELIDYYDITSWFENIANCGSPEGHVWGKKAHNIIGKRI